MIKFVTTYHRNLKNESNNKTFIVQFSHFPLFVIMILSEVVTREDNLPIIIKNMTEQRKCQCSPKITRIYFGTSSMVTCELGTAQFA